MRRGGFKRLTVAEAIAKRRGRQGKKLSRFGLKRGNALKAKRDAKLAAWSKAVRERDGNRCQWPGGCLTGDTRIDAHHIAERSLRPDLRYSPENGIALCRTHHDWIPLNREAAIAMNLLSTETYEASHKQNGHKTPFCPKVDLNDCIA